MEEVSPTRQFEQQVQANIEGLRRDQELQKLSLEWSYRSSLHNYDYNFRWMGRPIIQMPQDIVAMQEIIWTVKPDLIVETGIAHGGSSVFYASMLELLGGDGRVVSIDIDIRSHNRIEIEKHPMFRRIDLIEGSSVDEAVARRVRQLARGKKRVLVALDSGHQHDHVLKEMQLYAPLVSIGSYLVVFDTLVDDLPEELFADRPWGQGNNPKTAVRDFLKGDDRFVIDEDMETKLQLSVAPSGYLKRMK